MIASLAGRLRAIAADPTPSAIAELPRLAVLVSRIEIALDEIAADAFESAEREEAEAQANARARFATHDRPVLVK